MKKFEITIVITLLACISLALIVSCGKDIKEPLQEEIATAKAGGKNCFTVCDVTKNPDLTIVTNAEEERPLLPDGQIDSLSYFWTKYHVRTQPIRLTQNYVTPRSYAIRYGWDSNVVVNRVRLQCLVENIAPFGCGNDWVFEESQGYISPLGNYFFDGLFEFITYEWVGNRWKYLYTDYKKEWFPSSIPNVENIYNNDFCYYNRAVQAQMGDFYFNDFRYPNRDGRYRTDIKFNPFKKGCRAVKETNYDNNEKTVTLQILNGVVTPL
jgi:hypothetical protein